MNVKWTWDRTRHAPKVIIHTTAGVDAPVMKVNDNEVTLHDPSTEAYNAAHYHCQDIRGNGSAWLITGPADSTAGASDTWEIADSFGSTILPKNIITGIPVFDAPVIGQAHALNPSGTIAGIIPVIGSPNLSQDHVLNGPDIVVGVPVIDAPGLSQKHALDPEGLTAGSPALGTPTVVSEAGTDNVAAVDIVTGVPVLGAPYLDQALPDTPPVRIYDIESETRTHTIAYENRTLKV